MTNLQQCIGVKVMAERDRQDVQWGGATHDDSHELFEWSFFIDKQLKLADKTLSHEHFEERMTKVAALAVAAIESSMRQRSAKEVNG